LDAASVGKSRLRMYWAGPRTKALIGVDVVIGITDPADHVGPPSWLTNTASLKVSVPPVQFGSSILISSAVSYTVLPATSGCAPMYCAKLQPLLKIGTWLA